MSEDLGANFGRMLAAKAAYEDSSSSGGGGGEGGMGFEAFNFKGVLGTDFVQMMEGAVAGSDIGKVFTLGLPTIKTGIFELLNFLGQGTFDSLHVPKLDTLKLPSPSPFSKGRH